MQQENLTKNHPDYLVRIILALVVMHSGEAVHEEIMDLVRSGNGWMQR